MKLSTLIGAAIGIAIFLGIGLLPALLYGGYAGILLASGIFGAPVHATLAARVLIIFGMIMGTCAVGSLFTVVGAACGAACGALLKVLPTGIEPVASRAGAARSIR